MALEIQDIITSVSVPSLILDEFIRPGTFIKLRNGDVQSYVGGFSIVFPVQVNNETWAFRCWHTQIEDAYERYKLIGSYLSEKRLPYFCDFSYSLEGIVVNGKKFPTTKMKWVEGETIKEYICKFSSPLLYSLLVGTLPSKEKEDLNNTPLSTFTSRIPMSYIDEIRRAGSLDFQFDNESGRLGCFTDVRKVIEVALASSLQSE